MAEITHLHQKVIVIDFLVMKWKAKDFTCYMTKENLTHMTKNLIENRVHLVVIKSTIPDFLHLFCDRESRRSNSHGKHWNHSSVDGRKDHSQNHYEN